MEIPVINRIGDFEGGITSLQNPSFLSQALTLSGVERIHQAYSFWKWGALILAMVASFSTIINRIKILIIRIQNHYLIPSSPPLTTQQHYDSDSETDSSCSSSPSSSDDEQDEEEEEEEEDDRRLFYMSNDANENLSVKESGGQNCNFRRRRNMSLEDLFSSWSEFKNGKNVVKLWDNLGFGFGLNVDDNSRNYVSLHDMSKDQLSLFSIFGEKSDFPSVATSSSSSPEVIVSAETNASGHLLRVWDTRVGCRIPEILAEWRPRLGKFVGISGAGAGVGKVYVRDDVRGRLTVGDMRKAKSPLVNATETDVDTWWDADGVSGVGEEDSGADSVLLCS